MTGIALLITQNPTFPKECDFFISNPDTQTLTIDNTTVAFKADNSCQIGSAWERYMLLLEGTVYNLADKSDHSHNGCEREDALTPRHILDILIEKGAQAIHFLEGSFSLIFVDFKENQCFLARDKFGLNPLFWSFQGKILRAGTTPDFFDHAQLNLENLATLLKLRFLPAPLALVASFSKIEPGEIIQIDLTTGLTRALTAAKLPKKTAPSSDDSVFATYGELLSRAIMRQLPKNPEKKLGLFLSGGLDSSLLAAMLKKHAKVPFKAFTVGFDDRFDENEITEAKEIAEFFGIEHHVERMKFQDFLSTIEETAKILSEPSGTTSVIPMYHLAKLAATQAEVLFSGQGPDETGGGYTKYQGEYISSLVPRILISLGKALLPMSKIKNETVKRALYSLSERDDISRIVKIETLFDDEEIEKLLGRKEGKAVQVFKDRFKKMNVKSSATSVEKMMAIDTRLSLPDDLMAYTNNVCSHFGLDCRAPFMDADLVAFVEELKRKDKIAFRKGKIAHRKFAESLLPADVINRKKKGFLSPTKTWFSENNEQLRELLLTESFFTEVFNEKEVAKFIHLHQQGYNMEKQLFLLLSIYFWMKHRRSN